MSKLIFKVDVESFKDNVDFSNDLRKLDFEIEEIDFSENEDNAIYFINHFLDGQMSEEDFENGSYDKSLFKMEIENLLFVDIFHFIESKFYYYPSENNEYRFLFGSTLVFHKDKEDIIVELVEQSKVRKPELLHEIGIDEFDINSGNYFVSIKIPGGFCSYQIEGDYFN